MKMMLVIVQYMDDILFLSNRCFYVTFSSTRWSTAY